jgi:MOSC domain-containing protein
MATEIGKISELYCYPVKSMAGDRRDVATLGWHGIAGDRRFAVRKTEDQSGFPWLTAGRLRQLLLYRPCNQSESTATGEDIPTHVRTPDGRELPITGPELQQELSAAHGSDVQLMQLKHGIFDEAPVSIITMATISDLEREAGLTLEVLRFRPNIVIESSGLTAFGEDSWVGKSLTFGTEGSGPSVAITMRDQRCVMLNLDPNTAAADVRVMKAAVRMNGNNAGVYGTVLRTGELAVGQSVYLA